MPQKIFHNNNNKGDGIMSFLKTSVILGLMIASFAGGWFTSNKGYRVIDSTGNYLVKSNAAQIVKDENDRLGRQVIGMSESEASSFLAKNNRTFCVGVRDGKTIEHKGSKTFTNCTVQVDKEVVTKMLGWY
jgi:hypothetical protein